MQLTRVDFVPDEFKTKLPLSNDLLSLLMTSSAGVESNSWIKRKAGLGESTQFVMHTRTMIWYTLSRISQLCDGAPTPVVTNGKFNTASREFMIGEQSRLWCRHEIGMNRPRKPNQSMDDIAIEIVGDIVIETLQKFVSTYGDGLECHRYRVFVDGDSLFIHSKFE